MAFGIYVCAKVPDVSYGNIGETRTNLYIASRMPVLVLVVISHLEHDVSFF